MLYWVDPGVVRAVKRTLSPPAAEERGALLEGLVATVLRAHRDYDGLFEDWSYWSPAEAKNTEVDFLLRRGRSYVALEVKASRRAGAEHLRGLRAIEGLTGLRRRVLAYCGNEIRRTDEGIDLLPIGELFDALSSGRLF